MNVSLKQKLDYFLFGWVINIAYTQYYRPKYNYTTYRKLFFYYFIPQKIFRINGSVPWPVHYTSTVSGVHKIRKGIICDPGDNTCIYIQANNGINIGSNVGFGSGCKLISANHSLSDHSMHDTCEPISIGDNVFIGANSVVLPGIKIGCNVVIGAGSVVCKNIPDNSIAVGNPCKVIKHKSPYLEDFSNIAFNKKPPLKYRSFIKGFKYDQ